MKSKQFYSSQAWKYFAKYILLYYSNDEGYVQCSTSGVWKACNDKKMHAGHYIKVFDGTKTHMSVAFSFENVAPQSHKDNIYLGGKSEVMKEWLINKHSLEVIEKLHIQKHNICKLGKFEMDYFKKCHKDLFDRLVKARGFNPWG